MLLIIKCSCIKSIKNSRSKCRFIKINKEINVCSNINSFDRSTNLRTHRLVKKLNFTKTIHYWNTFGTQYYYNNFYNNNLSEKKNIKQQNKIKKSIIKKKNKTLQFIIHHLHLFMKKYIKSKEAFFKIQNCPRVQQNFQDTYSFYNNHFDDRSSNEV